MADFLISIATYKRPDLLADLLRSLEPEVAGEDVRIAVVDNHAEGTGRAVCEASPLEIEYVIEPRPGIAAARNRGLDLVARTIASSSSSTTTNACTRDGSAASRTRKTGTTRT